MLNFKKSMATLGATLMLLQGLPAMLQNNDKAEAANWKPSIQSVMSRSYPIVMGNQFSSGRIDSTKLNWCAKNLDILVINKSGDLFADNGSNSDIAKQIHAINPNVKVLQYVNIMDVWQSQPTYTWMKNNNAFLYDDAGKVVHPYQSSYGTQRWAGDSVKTNWQDYYANHCKDMVTQGMDGVFSDNWFRTNSQGWNISGTRFAQIQKGWETMGQKTKTAMGDNAILIGNSPAWSTYQSRDITMIESRNAPNSSAFNTFLKDSDTAAGYGQATLDTIYWVYDGSIGYMSTYPSILDFSLPACLLTDDIFGIQNNTEIFAIMDKVGKVGTPKAARYRANNILQRDFTAGKVLFNDTSGSVTVSLPAGVYKNVNGTQVNSVTLPSFRGVVLKTVSNDGGVITLPPADSIPAAPTNLALTNVTKGATSGNYYVNLTWKDNAANETGYEILQASSASGPFTVIKTPAVNAQGYSVNIGTTPGTYYYQVKAVNSVGKSEPSNTIEAKVGTVTPAPTAPAAPTGLTTNLTKGTTGNYLVELKWTDNSTNEVGFEINQTVGAGTAQVVKTVDANTTTYTVDLGASPTAGTYNYTVVASNSVGKSSPSNTGSVKVENIPAAPTSLALTNVTKGATSGNYYVNLTWKDNATNETGYEILQASSTSGPFTVIKTPAVNAQGYSVNIGTTPGTYYYQVKAVNSVGKSQPSNTIEAKVGLSAPVAPTGLTANLTKGTTGNYLVELKWTDNSTNEVGFEINQTVGAGTAQVVKTVDANATTYTADLGATPTAGTYNYTVVASNSVGKSSPSNTGSVKVENIPAAPTNLALTDVTKGATSGNYYVNLTWKDNATNETGYEILQASSASGPFTAIKTPAVNAQGYSVNIGTTPGTYYYQVKAVNSVGKSEPSNTIEAKVGTSTPAPTAPATPTNLVLTSVTKGATSGSYYINLTWKDNATNETGYEILESVNSTSSYQIIKTPAVNAQGYSVNIGASPVKGTHYYHVKAVNATGKSQPSNTVTTVIK